MCGRAVSPGGSPADHGRDPCAPQQVNGVQQQVNAVNTSLRGASSRALAGGERPGQLGG